MSTLSGGIVLRVQGLYWTPILAGTIMRAELAEPSVHLDGESEQSHPENTRRVYRPKTSPTRALRIPTFTEQRGGFRLPKRTRAAAPCAVLISSGSLAGASVWLTASHSNVDI